MRFFAENSALEKLVCFIAIAVSLKLNVNRILTPKIRRLNQRFLKSPWVLLLLLARSSFRRDVKWAASLFFCWLPRLDGSGLNAADLIAKKAAKLEAAMVEIFIIRIQTII
jgi:hypothetical protein